MLDRLRQLPPAAWIAAVMGAGLAFLVWHRYSQNDADSDWHNPMDAPVAPTLAGLPVSKPAYPAQHGGGRQMACSPAFRARSYAPDLVSADFSIIGEC